MLYLPNSSEGLGIHLGLAFVGCGSTTSARGRIFGRALCRGFLDPTEIQYTVRRDGLQKHMETPVTCNHDLRLKIRLFQPRDHLLQLGEIALIRQVSGMDKDISLG
jgi:hypothetical protein